METAWVVCVELIPVFQMTPIRSWACRIDGAQFVFVDDWPRSQGPSHLHTDCEQLRNMRGGIDGGAPDLWY